MKAETILNVGIIAKDISYCKDILKVLEDITEDERIDKDIRESYCDRIRNIDL